MRLLNLDITVGTAIYIGESNREHMRQRHPKDFIKYYPRCVKIITEPDYIGINSSDGSIEFIKMFGKNVKVAVRIAYDGDITSDSYMKRE